MSGGSFFGELDPIHLHVGRRLRELRTGAGLTQGALGRAVGITAQQIQKYEMGKNRISATMIYGLARHFGVPIAAFFEGLPDPALGAPQAKRTAGPVVGRKI